MALLPCPECKKEVSDKAPACPHCGFPLQSPPRAASATSAPGAARRSLVGGAVLVAVLAAVGTALALRQDSKDSYTRVEQYRADQDAQGTHDEHVRQRFYRLYETHPHNAMYIYLWARCVDDAAKQLDLANEGIRADPGFSWNYNMAARALARMNRVPDAYEQATKGAALDPGNLELTNKKAALKLIIDRKLVEQSKPAPSAYTTYDSKENFDKGAVKYSGLFRSAMRSPDPSDLQAIAKTRLPDYKGPISEAVRGLVVCANPFADACIRVYVPRDGRFKTAWQPSETDVGTLREHELVRAAGAVVTNGKGENILLADAVTVESP